MATSFTLIMGSILCLALLAGINSAEAGILPELSAKFEQASARSVDDQLTISTGKVERTLRWTGTALATTSFQDLDTGEQWVKRPDAHKGDWDLGDLGRGKLISMKAFENDDEGFTSKHLAVETEIHYPRLHVKHVMWAYPGAPGIRTQLWLKMPQGVQWRDDSFQPGMSERLELSRNAKSVFAFGYRAGLKADMTPYEILKEEKLPPNGSARWASGLLIEGDGGGVFLIKESHNHTHLRNGLETGAFQRRDNCIGVMGLGMRTGDLKTDRYLFCWANWMIAYHGGRDDAQLALKRFDRARFPVHPGRDVFIMANTWGTEDSSPPCRYKARQENVLRELKVCAELGIDMLQIDDGWQGSKWRPVAEARDKFEMHTGEKFDGTYKVYPDGFGKVRARAAELGVKLGLWHAYKAPIESIRANYDDGDFKAFKLDFANLTTKDALDSLYYKARDIIAYSKHTAVVNWDVTETSPRMGFYFGRDCGNLYLTNRKAFTVRQNVRYDPWMILRDAWELARFTNLNKIQVTYQNKDLTPPGARTDALKYTHGYNLAITLMASPIFFTETQYITPQAREELKPIIQRYKAHREKMYRGYVFAIGAKPDNASWTGLQNHNFQTGDGYLTIFRELRNEQAKSKLALHFLDPHAKLTLTDLMTGQSRQVTLDEKRQIEFEIDTAPGFAFLEYKTNTNADRPRP